MNPQRRQWLEQSAALLSTAAAGVAGLAAAGCSSTAPDVAPASPKAAGLPAQAVPAGARALAQARLSPAEQPPSAPREWRAAWVASVAHIDWPKQAGLSAATLRAQILDIVQRSQAMGLNALIVQVRPAADALYRSNLEPPSDYLHAQGQPGADFDALALWVQACHAQGLELHAWFNPYRARHPSARGPLHEQHVARRHPAWVHRYGDMLWLDPGQPDAQEHSLKVIADVVQRYDLDGVHVDDYFYPYPVKGADGRGLPFPDDESFKRHRPAGMGNSQAERDQWRRRNVDHFVEQMYRRVHALKPWVQVSISPFGIGRPDRRPAGIAGFSQYDQLHADVEQWCERGWLDALVPQLYWPRSRPAQSFEKLLDYWLATNPHGRHVWAGLYTSSVANGTPTAWSPDEILWQIDRQRERSASTGHAHFSLQALLQDRGGLAQALPRSHYTQRALTPAMPWLAQGPAPSAPQALRLRDGPIALMAGPGTAARRFAVWRRPLAASSGSWRLELVQAHQTLPAAAGGEVIVVQALDAAGREGPGQAFVVNA
ncbi:MAG: glycoside hydrolase family 10 protein [Betaproteobacteria bacterium]